MTLDSTCSVNGVSNVGHTTFDIVGTYVPTSPAVTIVPTFTSATFAGAYAVPPDPSVGLGVGPPIVTGVTPSSGSQSGGTQVQISGVGFASGLGPRVSAVMWGGAALPASSWRVVSDSVISVTTPAGTPMATVSVTVIDNGNQASPTSASYKYLPDPVVSSVSPSSGPGGQALVLRGSGFYGGQGVNQVTGIQFNCASCGYAFLLNCWTTVSDTEIDLPSFCTPTPGAYGYPTTTYDVLVTTSVATSKANAGDHWTYVP
jgi:hypothetical protein